MTGPVNDPVDDPVDAPVNDPANDDSHETVSTPVSDTFTLQQFPEKLAVVRLPPGSEVPAWAESSSIFSITATATETSLICAGRNVPTKTQAHRGLTAFAVQGPLDPEAIGVLAGLLVPLAEEGVSVFTLSTYDTDWVMVPVKDADRAVEAWRRRGHTVAAAVPVKPARSKPGATSRKQKKST